MKAAPADAAGAVPQNQKRQKEAQDNEWVKAYCCSFVEQGWKEVTTVQLWAPISPTQLCVYM